MSEVNENIESEENEEISVTGNDTIKIASEVVATYAGIAVSEVDGVYGMAGRFCRINRSFEWKEKSKQRY